MYFVMKWICELQVLKNKIAIILAGQLDVDLSCYLSPEYYIIAVDGGLDHLASLDIGCDILIGDMDSIGNKQYNGVQLVFDTVKDDTDFVCALKHAREYNSNALIEVFGFASINRLDHVIANISVIDKGMKFISKNQEMVLLTEDTTINKDEYIYYSFYALSEVEAFSLSGFKYPLSNYNLKPFDPLCVSNELSLNCGKIEISNGRVIMIKSKSN